MVIVPAATPVTTPELLTVPNEVFDEDHIPPITACVIWIVEPTVTDVFPEISGK